MDVTGETQRHIPLRPDSDRIEDEAPVRPINLFAQWSDDAHRSEASYPQAASLATVDPAGWPEARIVLVKHHGPEGLTFFTNYESDKARALACHPRAELCFHWKTLRRQVRVRGPVIRLPEPASDRYFAGRDRASQIGAWASDQSRICPDPDILATRCAALADRFRDRTVPRPPHWGGFLLSPLRWEFWQERESRLHQRDIFVLDRDGWTHASLFP